MQASSHQWARGVLLNAWRSVFGGEPGLPELQYAQAVAMLESSYGMGWKGAGVGSNNWGAIQSGHPPCGGNAFLYTDTHPNADGTSTPYSICFRRYASPEAGAADVLRVLYTNKRSVVLDAAQEGNLFNAAKAQHDTGYYEGFGATVQERVQHYADVLERNVKEIAAANNEPVAITMAGPPPGGGWLRSALLVAGATLAVVGVGAAAFVLSDPDARARLFGG